MVILDLHGLRQNENQPYEATSFNNGLTLSACWNIDQLPRWRIGRFFKQTRFFGRLLIREFPLARLEG